MVGWLGRRIGMFGKRRVGMVGFMCGIFARGVECE